MNKKTIGIILARSKSKAIMNKNIKKVNNLLLINYALKELIKSKICSKIIISTDSNNYAKLFKKILPKKVVIFKRSKINARDKSSSESALLELFDSTNMDLKNYDNCVFVQLTSPLVIQKDFKSAYQYFIKNDYDSLFTGYKSHKFFWLKKNNQYISYNYDTYKRPRRQDFKGTIVENGAFYIFKISKFLKKKNRLFGKIGCQLMPENRSLEIDKKEDLNLFKFYLKK